MVSTLKLEIELQESFKKKEYSKVIFEIISRTNEDERSSSLCNLLGISRISLNKKKKDQVKLAVNDFKKGYLKEKTSENGFNALVNLVIQTLSFELRPFKNLCWFIHRIKKFSIIFCIF